MEQTGCSETSVHKIETPGNNLYLYKYRFSNLVPLFFLLTPPMKMEQTGCSETSVHKMQTPGNSRYMYKYRFSNLVPVILPAFTTYEDGTDRVFRNVGK